MLAVRWYLRFGLSYRDLEELLAERGIEVDHVTLFRWVQRFTPLLVDAARPCRHSVGGRWFVDETYVKVAGTWRYVYRAVDQHGQVIDVLRLSQTRHHRGTQVLHDRATAHGEPDEVVTDLAPALATRHRGTAARLVSQHRPVRQQPCRMRPRPPQSAATTDARTEDRPNRPGRHRGPCVHAEPAPRPLRTRRRRGPPCRAAGAFHELSRMI